VTFKIWRAEQDVRISEDAGGSTDRPSIAYLPNGGYVVGWRENNLLKFKVYNGNGDVTGPGAGTVYTVDGGTGNENNLNIQAIGTDGSFAISWNEGLTNNYDLKTRVFTLNDNGTYVGGPVNDIHHASSGNTAELASLTLTMDGGIVSTYMVGNDVYMAAHDASGARIGPQRQVHKGGSSSIDYPKATQITSNKFIFSFGEGDNIKYKVVTMVNGSPSSSADPSDAGSGDIAEVVALKDANGVPDGRFAIVQSRGALIVAKFYDQNGTRIGSETEVVLTDDGWAEGDHFNVTALRGGRIGVVYSGDAVQGKIVLKVTDINGKGENGISGPDALVIDATDSLKTPTITEMKDGRLAITWSDPSRTQSDISSAIVDPRLAPVAVNGTERNDYYVGSEHHGDVLRGYAGNDILFGVDGNDVLNGGTGADRLDGGAGFDIASYFDAESAVVANLTDPKLNLKLSEAEGDTYFGIEGLRGGAWHDILTGNNVANLLEGGDGRDTLYGGLGNDTINGGADSDTLYGGAGDDALNGGLGGDRLYAGDGADTLDGGDGSNLQHDIASYQDATASIVLDLSDGDGSSNEGFAKNDRFTDIQAYVGSGFNDTLKGTDAYDEFFGDNGNDLLQTKGDNDKLFGEAGNDTLEGGAGGDTLDGGLGFNFASYAGAGAQVNADLGGETAHSGDASGDVYVANTIQGLIGSRFNDNLWGNAASNILIGGAGSDNLYGLGGIDYASYANALGPVSVSLVLGSTNSGEAAGDTFNLIEGLIGSNFNDVLTGNDGLNTLQGGAGSDTLIGGAGADALWGDAGTDTVDYSSAGAGVTVNLAAGWGAGDVTAVGDTYASIENVIGSQFADALHGNGAANDLRGGNGDDTYHVSVGDAVIEAAGAGNDKIFSDVNYTLGANVEALEGTGGGALVLTGNALNNTIVGNGAGNWIDGGVGADTMMGGAGDDIYVVDNVGDVVEDYLGNNSIVTTVQLNPNNVRGNFAITVAEGFNFSVQGTSGNNVLKGNAAANTLKGNGGNDMLYGMLGNDKLYGGTGKDTFVFDTRLNKTKNVDKIYDFKSKDDTLHLDNAIFTKLGSGTAARPKKFKSDMFVEGKKAQDREDRIVYDKKTGALYYDKDGTGGSAQVKIATLTNKTKLYYHDFFVI
jgi:Ca2+-binding RTX toxin-like protein